MKCTQHKSYTGQRVGFSSRPVVPPRRVCSFATRLLEACHDANAPTDKWLAGNIHTWPNNAEDLTSGDVLCTVTMRFTKTKDDATIFYGPDYYTLWLHVEGLVRHNWSPLIIVGQHRGSSMDGDAPTWTHKLDIGKPYRFVQPQAFMAEVFCGLSSLRVGDAREQKLSLKMQEWAIANSEPENAEKIARHCARLSAHTGGVQYVQGEGSERYILADTTPPMRWVRGRTLRVSGGKLGGQQD
ncbi:hypothetical protein C8R47DRAFT_1107580 [Mycena vitilis]|nr:hypothetical protein C8R47DRAFT_1107580 [Mycena vitilis]